MAPPGFRGGPCRIVYVSFRLGRKLKRRSRPFRRPRQVRPLFVTLGPFMTLLPYPAAATSQIVADWGGRIFFDGAHQAGLIAGGQFQDPTKVPPY